MEFSSEEARGKKLSTSRIFLTNFFFSKPFLNFPLVIKNTQFAPAGGDCISLPQSGILKPGVHRLVITSASEACSGQYICQVTESRPPFKTEQAAASLRVMGKINLLYVLILPSLNIKVKGISKAFNL